MRPAGTGHPSGRAGPVQPGSPAGGRLPAILRLDCQLRSACGVQQGRPSGVLPSPGTGLRGGRGPGRGAGRAGGPARARRGCPGRDAGRDIGASLRWHRGWCRGRDNGRDTVAGEADQGGAGELAALAEHVAVDPRGGLHRGEPRRGLRAGQRVAAAFLSGHPGDLGVVDQFLSFPDADHAPRTAPGCRCPRTSAGWAGAPRPAAGARPAGPATRSAAAGPARLRVPIPAGYPRR